MKYQYCLIVSLVFLIVIVAGVFAIGYDQQSMGQPDQLRSEVKVQNFPPSPPVLPMISDNFNLPSTPLSLNVEKNKLIATLFKQMKNENKPEDVETTTADYVRRKLIDLFKCVSKSVNLEKKN